jgi:hypothetical protein
MASPTLRSAASFSCRFSFASAPSLELTADFDDFEAGVGAAEAAAASLAERLESRWAARNLSASASATAAAISACKTA